MSFLWHSTRCFFLHYFWLYTYENIKEKFKFKHNFSFLASSLNKIHKKTSHMEQSVVNHDNYIAPRLHDKIYLRICRMNEEGKNSRQQQIANTNSFHCCCQILALTHARGWRCFLQFLKVDFLFLKNLETFVSWISMQKIISIHRN